MAPSLLLIVASGAGQPEILRALIRRWEYSEHYLSKAWHTAKNHGHRETVAAIDTVYRPAPAAVVDGWSPVMSELLGTLWKAGAYTPSAANDLRRRLAGNWTIQVSGIGLAAAPPRCTAEQVSAAFGEPERTTD